MCGIFGYTDFVKKIDLECSRKALNTMNHRGPDQWGEWTDGRTYFGHRRLSILDLSENGKQPMVNNDKNVIITANGEIYNFKELRKELIHKYEFKSNSDSEVLLHGYREWGILKLLGKIDGMYAFCIYDLENGKIFLVRDRPGIKPLYYSTICNKIAWASELKALKCFYANGFLETDHTAIYDYLTYLYVPAPKTMCKNIFKLRPAHYLEIEVESKKIVEKQYWELKTSCSTISPPEAEEELRVLVRKSVKEQMVSDVPVGFFLSGGMDSSTVVASASHLPNQLNSFSIGFDILDHDETYFAQVVAEIFKTNHRKKILDQKAASNLFNNLKNWYDEPYSDTSAFPTFLVSQFAKEHVTVVLTGDGGDEIFGGYKWYKRFIRHSGDQGESMRGLYPLVSFFKSLNSNGLFRRAMKKVEQKFFLNALEIYAKFLGGMIKNEKAKYSKLWNIPTDYDDYWYFRKYYREDLPVFTRLQYLDFHTYLPDDILTKVDRVSMAVSLEARVPLLSKEIIEFSFGLSENTRLPGGELKGLMKSSFRDILPDIILEREKKGFSIPTSKWNGLLPGKACFKQETILRRCFNECFG